MSSKVAMVIIACSCSVGTAHAAYPDKPMRIIVPFAPGGNIDINGRVVASGLTLLLGQSVIVDNRAGAGGRIGTEAAAKAPPDGYTALLGSSGALTLNPAFYPSTAKSYTLQDFAFTSMVSIVPLVLVAHPSVPVRNLKTFIAFTRSAPGQLTMASAGTGSTTHIAGELFQVLTKTKLTHIPYKGGHPAMIDLISGQTHVMFDQVSTSAPHIHSGKVRPLGIATLKRSPMLPDVPTIDESGLPRFEASTYTGVAFPAATPPDRLAVVYRALTQVLDQSSVKDSFERVGADVIKSTPEEFAARLTNDLAKWTKLSKQLNLKLE
jgi:tripartite-type tricarboxylate transporter receptor subunit TctC